MITCAYNVVELSQQLIRIPSVTPDADKVIDWLVNLLSPMGFDCQILDYQSEGQPRVRNLFARYGTEGPHLAFAGHVDVVPEGRVEDWTHDPYGGDIHEDVLYGRGIVDMKGSIAAFISAMANTAIKGSISLIITGDEEGDAVNGTVRVLEEMRAQGQIPDVCLVGEPTSETTIGDTIKVGRRGSLTGQLIVYGIQGHVAYPHRADNPVRRIINFLEDLQNYPWDEGTEYFDPSNLEVTSIQADNIAANVIPATAEAVFNIRFNTEHTTESIQSVVTSIADIHLNDYTLTYRPGADPFLNSVQEWADLVKAAVSSVTGNSPVLSTSGGTSDARFIHQYCPVVELGLLNKTAHQVDEHASLTDLTTLEKIYRQVLAGFFA